MINLGKPGADFFNLDHPATIDLKYLSQIIDVGGTPKSEFHFFDHTLSWVGSSHAFQFFDHISIRVSSPQISIRVGLSHPAKKWYAIPFRGLKLDGLLHDPDYIAIDQYDF